jgi:hypothetical protein
MRFAKTQNPNLDILQFYCGVMCILLSRDYGFTWQYTRVLAGTDMGHGSKASFLLGHGIAGAYWSIDIFCPHKSGFDGIDGTVQDWWVLN